ncbi:MAG: 3'-5' exoribonuclease YhaM family protein [Gemmataceae bacterium]
MRQFLGQLVDGDAVDSVFVAADKQLRANRNGQPFIQIDLRDRSGGLIGRMWNAGETHFRSFEIGDYLRVRGKVQHYQGALQMIVTGFDRVEAAAVDPAEFLPEADGDCAKRLDRLKTLVRSVGDMHLRALVEAFLADDQFLNELCLCPAGVKNHHAYLGGLLEHVVTLLEGVDRLAPLYPSVNRDLWMIGIFLHDIGKVRELCYRQSFGYSDDGQLVGHLIQGVEMLEEKISKAVELTGETFPSELRLRLRHIIVSHHGEYEFGSPKLPMTLEAVAVNVLDNLDAKLNTAAREIKEDRGENSWTQYNPGLQRRFFKGACESEENQN